MRHYTANMQKGGAMVTECVALLREWEPGTDPKDFAERVIRENVIGKTSRNRVRDLLSRIFFRRYPPPVADLLHELITAGLPERDLHLLMLYQTALVDDLLYDFVTQHLFKLFIQGRVHLDATDATEFIRGLIQQGQIDPPWSDNIIVKTGRGLLATCRDFGLLEGHNRKQFVFVSLSQPVFLYVAYSLHERGVGTSQIFSHPDWRLFLLEEHQVERYFLIAHQSAGLNYEAAGGIRRIDWTWNDLRTCVRQLAEGAY